jgi:hypothetical protein
MEWCPQRRYCLRQQGISSHFFPMIFARPGENHREKEKKYRSAEG